MEKNWMLKLILLTFCSLGSLYGNTTDVSGGRAYVVLAKMNVPVSTCSGQVDATLTISNVNKDGELVQVVFNKTIAGIDGSILEFDIEEYTGMDYVFLLETSCGEKIGIDEADFP